MWIAATISALVSLLVVVPRLLAERRESARVRRRFEGVPVVASTAVAEATGRIQCVGELVVRGPAVRAPIRARDVAWVGLGLYASRQPRMVGPHQLTERAWSPVALTDTAGEIALDVDGAVVELDESRHIGRQFTTNLVGDPTPEVAAFLATRPAVVAPKDGHVTLAEWVIDAGDPVAVLGHVVRPEGPYRGLPRLRVERVRLLAEKY
jgi:hypothetical protein